MCIDRDSHFGFCESSEPGGAGEGGHLQQDEGHGVITCHSKPGRINDMCVCVYPFSREGGITLFGDHRGSILLNRAETSQEG